MNHFNTFGCTESWGNFTSKYYKLATSPGKSCCTTL